MPGRRHSKVIWRSIQRQVAEGVRPTPLLLHLLCRSERGWVMEQGTITLRGALFWLNLHRELLAADEVALVRMRSLIAVASVRGTPRFAYAPDLVLLTDEVEWVRSRVDHWLGLVDRLSRAAP